MANNFFKIDKGARFFPQGSTPTNPLAGDVYYDSVRNSIVEYINGNWSDAQSRSDVASAASLTSTDFTASKVQSSLIKLTGSTASNIHGITAHSDSKQIIIYNATSVSVTFKHESGTEGTAANKIKTSDSGDVVLDAGQSAFLAYDSAQSRWILLSVAGGSGSGTGSKNYFSNSVSQGNAVTGFNAYADAAGTLPVDMTGGAPSGNLTLASSASSPLTGLNSITLAKTAANLQGEGTAISFTLDTSDKGKVLAFSMNYAVASGTYADDDVLVYFYDATNSVLLQPTPYKLKSHSLGSDKFFCELQIPYNCSTLRMGFHVSSTSAVAYTLKFDDLLFGPQAKLYGSSSKDDEAYTLTIGGTTSAPTQGAGATKTAFWQKDGQDMIIKFTYKQTAAGAAGSGAYLFPLPAGYSIDTSKITLASDFTAANLTNTGTIVGFGQQGSTNAGDALRNVRATVFAYNSTNLAVALETSGSPVHSYPLGSNSVPNLVDTAFYLTFTARVPILGWSSSQLLSQDADTTVVTATVQKSTAQTVTNGYVKLTGWNTPIQDTVGMWNSGLERFEIKKAGTYKITVATGTDTSAGAASFIQDIRINGTQVRYGIGTKVTGMYGGVTTFYEGSLKAGDYIETFVIYQNGTGFNTAADALAVFMTVEKTNGPAQVVASEKIIARYSTNAGQSIPNNTQPTVLFEDKSKDSHGSYNTSTGEFTCLRAGDVDVFCMLQFPNTAGWDNTEYADIAIFKNGSIYSRLDSKVQTSTHNQYVTLSGSDTITDCIAGDKLTLRVFQNTGASIGLTASNENNHITFKMD